MRKHYCSPFGPKVDLDDPNIYYHLPKTWEELDALMLKEIGYSLIYMNIWYPDIWGEGVNKNGGQRERVLKLIQNFADNRKDNYNNIQWYREQVFLFQDEIENMC